MDDLPVIHLCLFGCGLVVNSTPTRQSDLGPHTKPELGPVCFLSGFLVFFTNFTAIDFFFGPYSGSRKEPDFMVRVDNVRLPTIVMESGWSESWDNLMDDLNT